MVLYVAFDIVDTVLRKELFRPSAGSSAFAGVNLDVSANRSHLFSLDICCDVGQSRSYKPKITPTDVRLVAGAYLSSLGVSSLRGLFLGQRIENYH